MNAARLRLVALTFGTEGDSRPMVALCRGLVDAGHDVVLLCEQAGQSYAAACGVPFVPLAGDMAAALQSASAEFLRSGGDVTHTARALAEIARANTTAWMRATLEHAVHADAIVAAGLAIYVGLSCAEHLGLPAIGAGLQPMMPTRAFASPFLPPWPLPGVVNVVSHRLVLGLMWRAFRGAINDARRAHGLAPLRHTLDQMTDCDRVLMLSTRAPQYPGFDPLSTCRSRARLEDPEWAEPAMLSPGGRCFWWDSARPSWTRPRRSAASLRRSAGFPFAA